MKKQIIAMMIAVAAAASVSTTADASWLSKVLTACQAPVGVALAHPARPSSVVITGARCMRQKIIRSTLIPTR